MSLYDDLIDPHEENEALKRELAELKAKLQLESSRNAELRRTLADRDEEIETLKKNVSAVYHTAKREIERTKDQVAKQQQQLKQPNVG